MTHIWSTSTASRTTYYNTLCLSLLLGLTTVFPGFGDFFLGPRPNMLVGGTTITIDARLGLAGVTESLIVTGASPTLDVKTTRLGGTVDLAQFQDVASAIDLCPGIRMRGYLQSQEAPLP